MESWKKKGEEGEGWRKKFVREEERRKAVEGMLMEHGIERERDLALRKAEVVSILLSVSLPDRWNDAADTILMLRRPTSLVNSLPIYRVNGLYLAVFSRKSKR